MIMPNMNSIKVIMNLRAPEQGISSENIRPYRTMHIVSTAPFKFEEKPYQLPLCANNDVKISHRYGKD